MQQNQGVTEVTSLQLVDAFLQGFNADSVAVCQFPEGSTMRDEWIRGFRSKPVSNTLTHRPRIVKPWLEYHSEL
jgi:hypothetical protein